MEIYAEYENRGIRRIQEQKYMQNIRIEIYAECKNVV